MQVRKTTEIQKCQTKSIGTFNLTKRTSSGNQHDSIRAKNLVETSLVINNIAKTIVCGSNRRKRVDYVHLGGKLAGIVVVEGARVKSTRKKTC